MILKQANNNLINQYIQKFRNDRRYYIADQAIIKLFNKFPENKNIEDVLLKISVINDLYSTNIYGTYKMAEYIKKLNVDSYIKKGDPKIVNKIAKIKINGKQKNFYSFATKYCSWHNQLAYPIYDRFVANTLMAYKKKDNFSSSKRDDLRDYMKFKQILTDFQKFYKLNKYNFKQIDKFLWMYGKEMFK